MPKSLRDELAHAQHLINNLRCIIEGYRALQKLEHPGGRATASTPTDNESNAHILRALELNEDKSTLTLEPRKDFDPCIVGVLAGRDGWAHLCYSEYAIVRMFRTRDGMTREEAREFFEYNTVRSLPYMESLGAAPVILRD